MNSGKDKPISENVLRMEMEKQMTEEERILAARMARIAELAEKKNATPKANPILKEIHHPQRELPLKPKSTVETNTQQPKKVVFLSKAQREQMKKEEEAKKKEMLEKKKEQMMRKRNEFSREETLELERKEKEAKEEERKRQHENESTNKEDDEYTKAIEEGIKKQYIGVPDKKPKIRNKRNSPFLMQWRDEDDTSEQMNPLYKNRAKVHLGFGKGYIAGIDMRKQRKDSQYMESLLAIRQEAEKEAGVAYNNTQSSELNRQLLQSIKQKQMEKDEVVEKRDGNGAGSIWSEKALSAMTQRDWRIMREEFEIHVTGARSINPLRTWDEAAIDPSIRKAIDKLGYKYPSPIQRQAIPIELKGMDMIGLAKTGSGKTCAFVVPMLQFILQSPVDIRIKTREEGPLALIMAPTRELAKQIQEETMKLAQYCYEPRLEGYRDPHIKAVCIVGGESITQQSSLTTNGCDILIGTPGRLLDCLDHHYITLNQTNYIVLDEADRMIDEGFEDSVNTVLNAMGSTMKSEEEEEILKEADENISLTNMYRTTIMFSATMAPKVELLAKRYMRCPVQVTIGSSNQTTNVDIKQIVNMVRESQKPAMLEKVIRNNETPAIVFCNRKETVDSVNRLLYSKHYHCVALRSGISQDQREKSLEDFRNGRYDILVATNVAARGLDIKGVKLVVNYDMPTTIDYYIHRIGRTGRAGATGIAISFVTESDSDIFPDLVDYLREKNQSIPFELERHKAVKEASQLSKFKVEENEDGTVNPTEFKMIFYVCLKMICERNNEIIKIDIQYYDIK